MKSITFVCLGNICRSPIAQGCATKLSQKYNLNLEIDSSGTSSYHNGENPCPNSIKVCKKHNIDISHYKSTQFKKTDIDKFDLVVALDENNYYDLKSLGAKNVVKLGDYGYDGDDVPDPYYFNGFEGFDRVFEMIDSCVKNLFKTHFL